MSLKELVSAANQSVDQSKLVLWPSIYTYMIKMTKANQFNSPEEVFFPKKYWLPQVGFEPMTLDLLSRLSTPPLSNRDSSIDMSQNSYTNTRQDKLSQPDNKLSTKEKVLYMW